MSTIRLYQPSDYEMVKSWWERSGEPVPLETMIPADTTFICEDETGVPLLTMALYLTNIKEYCYIENLVGNPDIKGPARRSALLAMLQYIESFAKEIGYNRVVGLAYRAPLKHLYQEALGGKIAVENVTAFYKIL